MRQFQEAPTACFIFRQLHMNLVLRLPEIPLTDCTEMPDIFWMYVLQDAGRQSASTMQVVNALIKANKNFELVVVPGARHTMGESYGEHKRFDFFVRHLMKVNPPEWEKL